jgi:hypothetical protein
MKIIIDNREYNGVNCKNWRLKNMSPDCALNLDLNQCNSCPSKVSRNGDFKNPPIFVLTVQETEKKIQEDIVKEKVAEPTFTQKAKSYIKAEGSQAIAGKVNQEVFEKRKEICMSCEYRIEQHKTYKDSIGWCKGGCGCSLGNQRAALSQKLYMPTLSCPKGKFGPEKGEGFNVSDAVDSVKGIVTSVKNLFEKDK